MAIICAIASLCYVVTFLFTLIGIQVPNGESFFSPLSSSLFRCPSTHSYEVEIFLILKPNYVSIPQSEQQGKATKFVFNFDKAFKNCWESVESEWHECYGFTELFNESQFPITRTKLNLSFLPGDFFLTFQFPRYRR